MGDDGQFLSERANNQREVLTSQTCSPFARTGTHMARLLKQNGSSINLKLLGIDLAMSFKE